MSSPSGRVGRPASKTRDEALARACASFEAGERIEIRGLAANLGLGRTTVHSWFGTREDLIARVLVRRGAPLWQRARDEATGTGAERILDTLDRYNRLLAADEPLRVYIDGNREQAHRVLTLPSGRVHRTVLAGIADLIDAETARGAYKPPIPAASVALALTRLGEAFLLLDALDDELDVDAMRDVQRTMLALG